MLFQDGSYYKGQFVNNELDGQGEYFWKDKYRYVGYWKSNRKNGYGVMEWING